MKLQKEKRILCIAGDLNPWMIIEIFSKMTFCIRMFVERSIGLTIGAWWKAFIEFENLKS